MNTTYNPAWSTGVWYHDVVQYDASIGQLSLDVTIRSTGEPFVTLSTPVSSFPSDTVYLGVSRLDMQWDGGNSVDYNLDNINLSEVPEPATVSLLALGGLLLLRRRKS